LHCVYGKTINVGKEQHYILNELRVHCHSLQSSELEAGTWETFCYTFIVYIPHTREIQKVSYKSWFKRN